MERRDRQIFALLLCGFFAVIAALSWWKPRGLMVAGLVLGAAWLVALLFNRTLPLRTRVLGMLLPGLFLAAALPVVGVLENGAVAAAVVALGLVLGLCTFASATAGEYVFDTWMESAEPIGWSISNALLAVVWYGVITPIGVSMRLAGWDAMSRRWDPEAGTYWSDRRPAPPRERYFRQF